MEKTARYWIGKLGLSQHPEGGFFAPAYRCAETMSKERLPDRFPGDRPVVSSIYYLLEKGRFSAFHRLKSVEILNFCTGSPLLLYILHPEGNLSEKKLGRNLDAGELFQAVIEPGRWFAAEPAGEGEFSLISCTVIPGFDYEDFELAARYELTALYPGHRKIIERLSLP